MISRIASLVIAIAYLILAYFAGGPSAVVKIAIYLTLPLARIWYSDELGACTGVMRGQYINTESPGCLVAFGGWLLLLMPVIMPMIAAFSQHCLGKSILTRIRG